MQVTQSFELYTNNIQTLSNNIINPGSDVEGLLYVPRLNPSDPCANATSKYIPSNVTRLEDLPSSQYTYIAFAPWISAACTQSYLVAARGTTAFLFYVPSQNTTVLPPPPSDQTWNLNDGGQWKSQNRFPVYALPGANGATIMQQMALYSGNVSQVKNGDLLVQQYNPSDYIRLYAIFSSGSDSNLPTLWAFLLIVLGVVLILVGATSLSMHLIQRRRRRDLQRRVERGEVDLEMLGIKRHRLTQAEIDTLPLASYIPNEKKGALPLPTADSYPAPQNSALPAVAASPQDYNQPTCPICLEDYEPHKTSVRSLPCHHIYHPECIDPFLLGNTSLCPVCKAKVQLNPRPDIEDRITNCPTITNVMVRRERYARRLRQRREQGLPADDPGRWAIISRRFRAPASSPRGRGFRSPAVPAPTFLPTAPPQPTTSHIEMGTVSHPTAPTGTTPAAIAAAHTDARPTPPQDPERRREWARHRASALIRRGGGIGDAVNGDVEGAGEARRDGAPKCESILAL